MTERDNNGKDNEKRQKSGPSTSSFDYQRQRYNDAFRRNNDPPNKDYFSDSQRKYRAQVEDAEKKRREEEFRKQREDRLFRMTEGTWSQSKGKNYR